MTDQNPFGIRGGVGSNGVRYYGAYNHRSRGSDVVADLFDEEGKFDRAAIVASCRSEGEAKRYSLKADRAARERELRRQQSLAVGDKVVLMRRTSGGGSAEDSPPGVVVCVWNERHERKCEVVFPEITLILGVEDVQKKDERRLPRVRPCRCGKIPYIEQQAMRCVMQCSCGDFNEDLPQDRVAAIKQYNLLRRMELLLDRPPGPSYVQFNSCQARLMETLNYLHFLREKGLDLVERRTGVSQLALTRANIAEYAGLDIAKVEEEQVEVNRRLERVERYMAIFKAREKKHSQVPV